MINKETLVEELKHSTARLLGHLSAYSETEFNFHPSANQWSAADIAEHLLILEEKINAAINGNVLPAKREPGSKIEIFRPALQNRSIIINAPEVVHPSSVPKDKEKTLAKLQEQRNKMEGAALTADLTATCMDFSHPFLGKLTRFEWIWFTIYHSERHVHQLQKLKT